MGIRFSGPEEADALVDAYYREDYSEVHASGGLAQANGWMHQALEHPVRGQTFPRTLELGAGNGQHLRHVSHEFSEYVATDIRHPSTTALYSEFSGRFPERSLVIRKADCLELPFDDGFADRVVAGCLLMHLADPLAALLEWQRVCSDLGRIDFVVPCDPGLFLRVSRRFVSETAARQQGRLEEYRMVNALDHVSAFPRVHRIARAAIRPNRRLTVKYYPFRIPSWNTNLFAIFSIVPRSHIARS